MSNETPQERVARVQRRLKAIKAYHADYLARRKRVGVHTITDALMEEHQQTYEEILDLLEAFKLMLIEQAEEGER